MAKPQLENGYIRIARELVEQFCKRWFNGEEWRILWAVIRKTYGYNKREDVIPYSQFCDLTGMNKRSVGRTLKALKIKRVLIIKTARTGCSYRINKNYDEWMVAVSLPGGSSLGGSEEATEVVATPRIEVVATPRMLGGSEEATLNKQIDNRQGILSLSDLKTETENFKNLGWNNQKIKAHFLMREIPEADIDFALGKHF